MSRYYVDNRFAGSQQNIGTTAGAATGSIVSVFSGSRRGRCVGLAVGTDSAPNASDTQVIYQVLRQTVDGTGSAATPTPRFPADTASEKTSKVNYTIAPTAALIQWSRSLNQRASMQWAAQDVDAMILWPATAANGLTVCAFSPIFNTAVQCGMEYEDV